MQGHSANRILFSTLAIGILLAGVISPAMRSARLERKAPRVPPGMVLIPAGEFICGSDDPDADEDVRPARRINLPAFFMDRTEVTNADYHCFDPAHPFAPGEENLPVTNVTYDEAAAYAQWAGKRLPTEEEWEKAARGVDGRRYPWGDSWDVSRTAVRAQARKSPMQARRPGVCSASRVRPVGSAPGGAGPSGCVDMAGNAWEWVQGYYEGNSSQRILRGGAVGYGERACRTYARAVEGSGVT